MNGLFSPENRAAVRDLWTALRDLSRELRGHATDPTPADPLWHVHTDASPTAAAPRWHDRVTTPSAVSPEAVAAPGRASAPGMIVTTSGKLLLWGSKIRTTSGKLWRSWGEGIVARARDARRDVWRDASAAGHEMRSAVARGALAGISATRHEMRSAVARAALAGIAAARHEATGRFGVFLRMWTDARLAVKAMAKAARVRMWTDGTEALRAMSAARVWATWRASGYRVPDAAKVLAGGIAVVAVILGIGYGAGHLGEAKRPAAQVTPSAAPSKAAEPALVPAVVAIPEAGPKVLPLSRFNPITGPGRPPLPEDVNGPQGSLRTTGTYEVALTFDDGPDPRWTPQVLDLLRQYSVKATFCVIGVNVVEFPELVRDIDAEGHTLCNHSWAHDVGLGTRSHGTIVSDMQRTNDAIRAAAPRARISYFRHPGGAWTQTAVSVARGLGMTSVHWDVDPKDWLKPGARSISTTVVGSTIPGSIVLMHDGGGDRRGTADALRSILPNLVTRFPLVALPPGVDPPKLYGIQLPIHAGQE